MRFTKQEAKWVYFLLGSLILLLLLGIGGVYYYQHTKETVADKASAPENQEEQQLLNHKKQKITESVDATESHASVETLIAEYPEAPALDDFTLQLINKENRFNSEPDIPLAVDAVSGQSYREEITENVQNLMTAASDAGYSLYIISGYRSIAYQEQNRANNYQLYLQQTQDETKAQELTDRYVAPADGSEHTTGLAIDFLGTDWLAQGKSLSPEYEADPSAQWLKTHAPEYGFILRYRKDKEEVTGYGFEPWHFRYVGVEPAKYMTKHGLTLEEYRKIGEILVSKE